MKNLQNIPDELYPMWDKLKEADTATKPVTDAETDSALKEVWAKIGQTEQKSSKKQSTIHPLRRYFSVAAAITIAVFLSYALIPVNVQVPTGEVLTMTLPDASKVNLNAGSSLSYNRLFGLTHRNLKLNGEAFFEVQKDQKPFTIKTHDASITVLGTRFNVDAWPAQGTSTRVTVDEGRVALKHNETKASAELTAGETARIMSEQIESVKGGLESDLAWLEGHFAFTESSLSVLFSELSRSYGINIELRISDADSKLITAYYNRPDKPEFIIRDICQVRGLSYRKSQNGYIIEE